MAARKKIPTWFWFPPIILTICAGIGLWWLYSEDHFARQIASIMLPIALVIIVLIYSLCALSSLPRLKIIGAILLLAVLGVGFRYGLLRSENSYSGAAIPNFAWRWSPEKDEGLADLTNLADARPGRLFPEGPLDSGLVDSCSNPH